MKLLVGRGLAALAFPLVLLAAQAHSARPIDNLTVAERNDLRDPFFRLVLAREPAVQSLSQIEALIQPDSTLRRLFVVDERIADPKRGQSRRAVLVFQGEKEGFNLNSNVALSVSFSSELFDDQPPLVEAWGWDQERSRYNYYSLEHVTPQTRRWFFHGSSDDVDLNEGDRGRCLSCHRSGAPLMKELFFPWNNWHSNIAFSASYLTASDGWPVRSDAHIAQNLRGAESLEVDVILPSLKRFNQARIERDIRADSSGTSLLVNARRILQPLFVPTEFNIVTSRERSNMHPLEPNPTGKPSTSVQPPASFFLNADLLGGNAQAGVAGIGITEALGFGRDEELRVQPDEYVRLVEGSSQRVANTVGADSVFAWLTPEPSFVDNHMVDQLVHERAVPAHFVAAALAVDLEEPLLSAARARLLATVPDSFRFERGRDVPPEEHELVQRTIQNLLRMTPAAGTPERMFLERLQAADALELLRGDVSTYLSRVKSRLASTEREVELDRLFGILLRRRQAVLEDSALRQIVESEDLFPLP